MPLPEEIDIDQDAVWAVAGDEPTLMDAIDAASDQDHTTWLTSGGRRIAKIAPVDEIPGELLSPRPVIAHDEVAELLEFAGQVRAAMRRTSEAYDTLFGQAGSRLLRAGIGIGRESLRARGPQDNPLSSGQPVLFLRQHEDRDWEPGTFLRYGAVPEAFVMADGREVRTTRSRVVAASPELADHLAAKRAETEPVWQEGLAATSPESLPVSRGLLIQVLTDAGLDQDKAITAWNALWSLTLGIHPDGKPVTMPGRSGRPEDVPPAKMTPRGPLTLEAVSDALSMAEVSVRLETLAKWTFGQRADAYDWAIREHLAASDNQVERVARPSFIPGAES